MTQQHIPHLKPYLKQQAAEQTKGKALEMAESVNQSESSASTDKLASGGLRRRDFFKVLAAGGATGTLAACSDAPEQLVPYLVPPDIVEYTPGQPIEYATTCTECSAHCGMLIRTREGRAIKAEGNPDHPLSQGKLCMRGQASLQTHYNPARITSAMRRDGSQWKKEDWDAAESQLAEWIKAVPEKKRIVWITDNTAGNRGSFLDGWLKQIGAAPMRIFDPSADLTTPEANYLSFRLREIPQYRMEQARYLLNFGAEFLERGNMVENARNFAEMHAFNDEKKERKGKFIHVGPHRTLTGHNADEWLNIAVGSEGVVALAIVNELLKSDPRRVSGFERAQIVNHVKPYTIKHAAEVSGISEAVLKRIAKEFGDAKPSLALCGGYNHAHQNATSTQIAVNLLNYVAGNIGKTIQFGVESDNSRPARSDEWQQWIAEMERGEVDLLLIDGVNPLYALPPSSRFEAALARVPRVVSFAERWDETTAKAHLVLPNLSALERWGDSAPRKGIYSLIQPAMAPLYPIKATEDTLLSVTKKLSDKPKSNQPASYQEYLKSRWRRLQTSNRIPGDFEAFWRSALQRGGLFQKSSASASVQLQDGAFKHLPDLPELTGEGLVVLPAASIRHGNGAAASNPWLQEIPDPISQVMWDSWADLHPETAKHMGVKDGELIRITTDYGQVELAARLQYGVNKNAVAVPLGLGRSNSGRNADNVGVNVMTVLPMVADPLSGALAFVSVRANVTSNGQAAYLAHADGSPRQLGRGIIQTQSVAMTIEGKARQFGHDIEGHQPRERDMYPKRKEQAGTPGYHDPYRWGMTVDSDRCTGCSACVAACYAENNIPVVGKERVALGREMAWISVNRFIEGDGDETVTLMQPMFCQQCGNAGCEPVCPVYATYHNPEGLNAQVYNRCVGTRYCSNNCAYKVRRFNWFHYEWEKPLHMQLNPDVSVRSKGVMEKCTFCVQRINQARRKAYGEGREVQDGDIQPACVQTCPSSAMTFGNLADAGSEVSKKALRGADEADKRVRQYEVLEVLKQLPAVTYLRKITEKPLSSDDGHHEKSHG